MRRNWLGLWKGLWRMGVLNNFQFLIKRITELIYELLCNILRNKKSSELGGFWLVIFLTNEGEDSYPRLQVFYIFYFFLHSLFEQTTVSLGPATSRDLHFGHLSPVGLLQSTNLHFG